MLKKDIKFVRNDIRRFNLGNYLGVDDELYWIDLGIPSKTEQAIAFSVLGDVPLDLKDINNQKIMNSINIKNFDIFTYSNIAGHIYDTNIAEKDGQDMSFDERVELIRELDRKNPEIIDKILEMCSEIDSQETDTTRGKKKK